MQTYASHSLEFPKPLASRPYALAYDESARYASHMAIFTMKWLIFIKKYDIILKKG